MKETSEVWVWEGIGVGIKREEKIDAFKLRENEYRVSTMECQSNAVK